MPCAKSSHQSNMQNSEKAEHQNCAFQDLDHSILQHPLHSGVRNVKQILKCLQDATKEVKDIILNECNIIYECRVCASLFRGLANFMYHKRCYCKNHLCEEMLLFKSFEEDTVVVQPDPPIEKPASENESVPENLESIVDIGKDSKHDESSVSEAKNSKVKQRGRKSTEVKKFEDPMVSRRTRDKRKRGKKSIKVIEEFTETEEEIDIKEACIDAATNYDECFNTIKQTKESENSLEKEETVLPVKTKAQIVNLRKQRPEFMESYKIVQRISKNNKVDEINDDKLNVCATQNSNEMQTKSFENQTKTIKENESKIINALETEMTDCKVIESETLHEEETVSVESDRNDHKQILVDIAAGTIQKETNDLVGTANSENKVVSDMNKFKKENSLSSICPKLNDAIENLRKNTPLTVDELKKRLEVPKSILPVKKIVLAKPNTIQIKNQAVLESIRKNFKVKGNIGISQITQATSKNVKCLPKIILKTIDSSSRAVFQTNEKTLTKFDNLQNSAGSSKQEKVVLVLNKDLVCQESTAAANKIVPKEENKDLKPTEAHHMTRRKRLLSRNDCNVQELKCLTCNTIFTSLKTLYFHMLSIHSKKRLYYPCPLCKALFVQIYGATRHLQMKHNKSKEQINKLRDSIKKKCVWKKVEDVCIFKSVMKRPENEDSVVEIKTEDTKSDYKDELHTVSVNNSNKDNIKELDIVVSKESNKISHQCSKCGRVFGRKSSQVSHEKFCIMNAIKAEPVDLIPETPVNQPMVSILSLTPQKSNIEIVSNKSIQQVIKSNVSQIGMSIRPKRKAEKQMHKDFINSQTLKWRSVNKVVNIPKVTPTVTKKDICQNLEQKDIYQNLEKKDLPRSLEKKVSNIMDTTDLVCLKCSRTFSSFSNLKRHVAIHVGWTRFKCKKCDFQSYNKSQCLFHIQKTHNVPDDQAGRFVQDLRSNLRVKKSDLKPTSHSPKSNAANSPKRTTPILKKKHNYINIHKKSQSVKKEISVSKNEINNKKDKSLDKKGVGDIRKDSDIVRNEQSSNSELKKVLLDFTKEKDTAARSVPKGNTGEPPENANGYKSVTTNNPTTIILSKKVPVTSVQSVATISTESQSSSASNKTFQLRSSPRKSETKPSEEKETYLVTRSTTQTKGSIQIKLSPPNKPTSAEIEKKPLSQYPEKNFIKKEKLISQWFPKKDLNSNTSRRESAPLIIGLVPASSSGMAGRSKNPAITYGKNNS